MASGSGPMVHVCETCGKTTTKKGHLCAPVPIEPASLAVCDFCGQTAADPRHVCFPKRLELKYACENCGRLATTRSLLCSPRAIPKPKPASAGAARTGKKKTAGKTRAAAASPKKPAARKGKKK